MYTVRLFVWLTGCVHEWGMADVSARSRCDRDLPSPPTFHVRVITLARISTRVPTRTPPFISIITFAESGNLIQMLLGGRLCKF